jgi:hypothetical protein
MAMGGTWLMGEAHAPLPQKVVEHMRGACLRKVSRGGNPVLALVARATSIAEKKQRAGARQATCTPVRSLTQIDRRYPHAPLNTNHSFCVVPLAANMT